MNYKVRIIQSRCAMVLLFIYFFLQLVGRYGPDKWKKVEMFNKEDFLQITAL